MTPKELKERVDFLVSNLDDYDNEHMIVRIPASRSNPSIGPRGSVDVHGISRGFDWDHHSIFVDPSEQLAAGEQDLLLKGRLLHRIREEVWMTLKMSKQKTKYYDFFKRVIQILEKTYGKDLGIKMTDDDR
jgi:hypothetical protein